MYRVGPQLRLTTCAETIFFPSFPSSPRTKRRLSYSTNSFPPRSCCSTRSESRRSTPDRENSLGIGLGFLEKNRSTRTQGRRNTRCSLDRWIKSPSREWNIILGACQLSLGCSVRFLSSFSLSLSLSFRFSKHRRFQYLFARGVRRQLLQLSSVLQRIIFFELSAVKINAFVVDSLHILTVRARHLLAF